MTHSITGFTTFPMNRTVPVVLSRIRKINGWFAVKETGGCIIAVIPIMIAVAAAASVPLSSTATKALWIASEIDKNRVPSIPEKSAASENAEFIPRDIKMLLKLVEAVVNLNFGIAISMA